MGVVVLGVDAVVVGPGVEFDTRTLQRARLRQALLGRNELRFRARVSRIFQLRFAVDGEQVRGENLARKQAQC